MLINVNGTRINCRLEGLEGAPVITMSHSLATNLALWDPQADALMGSHRILRFDTRGHGASDAPAGPYSLELLADDACALLAALGIRRTHFMGISMGGMIGQVLALKHPELLESLILCDTSSRVPPEAGPLWDERIRLAMERGMEPHVEPTLERWFTAGFRKASPDEVEPVRAMIRATPPQGYAGCCEAIRTLDLAGRLAEIKVPTLIIVGEDDSGTPVAESAALHERIGGSELRILKSAAHLSNREQPDAFNRAVAEFLASVESGARAL